MTDTTEYLKSLLTAAGCTLVTYESEQLSNIFTDEMDQTTVAGIVKEPELITFETTGNGVNQRYNFGVEILKQVVPERPAENNRATLDQLRGIVRDFIYGIIGSKQYHKITNVNAVKINERKYDANVIGWSLVLELRPLENRNNCEIDFPTPLDVLTLIPYIQSATNQIIDHLNQKF